MKQIKFSFPFSKLIHNGELIQAARLMQVFVFDLIDLSQELRDYNTDFGKHELPKTGQYLLLMFKHPGGGLFTTMRRYTKEKADFYNQSVGFVFQINVIERV